MFAENIICFIIYLICACIMFAIGFSQLKSKKPVGFYSGEKPLTEEKLTDVHGWNLRHGVMWIIYGFIIIFSFIVSFFVGDSVWCIVPFCGGLIIPIIIMIFYHHKLIKKYMQ